MGLTAVVFRNLRNMENMFPSQRFSADEPTGEVNSISQAGAMIPRETYFAVRKRLGNIAEIGRLRNLVLMVLDEKSSVLINGVLYSGTHCGDILGLEKLPDLRAEITRLEHGDGAAVKQFVDAMRVLIEAAEAEQNPIVFI